MRAFNTGTPSTSGMRLPIAATCDIHTFNSLCKAASSSSAFGRFELVWSDPPCWLRAVKKLAVFDVSKSRLGLYLA